MFGRLLLVTAEFFLRAIYFQMWLWLARWSLFFLWVACHPTWVSGATSIKYTLLSELLAVLG